MFGVSHSLIFAQSLFLYRTVGILLLVNRILLFSRSSGVGVSTFGCAGDLYTDTNYSSVPSTLLLILANNYSAWSTMYFILVLRFAETMEMAEVITYIDENILPL